MHIHDLSEQKKQRQKACNDLFFTTVPKIRQPVDAFFTTDWMKKQLFKKRKNISSYIILPVQKLLSTCTYTEYGNVSTLVKLVNTNKKQQSKSQNF
jgi:hypothetical protein